jgi:tetratricopeptide (TPR) repeat protein
MRVFCLVFILLLFHSTVDAQFRKRKKSNEQMVQGTPEQVVSHVKSHLTDITGWVLKDNTKWISAKNFIRNPDPKYTLPDKVLGLDNISEMEIRESQLNGKMVAVLVLKYLIAKYEFPTIKEGFYEGKALDFYVFPAEKLLTILPDTLSNGSTNCINFEVIVSGKIENYDQKDIDFEITTAIQRISGNRIINPQNLILGVMPYNLDGKDHVKFKLIKTFPSEKLYQPYLMDDIKGQLFNKSYFETKRSTFSAFFSSASVLALTDTPLGEEPTDFQGYFIKGVREYERGDYYNAITDFTNAIRLQPNQQFYPVYAYRGNAKFKLNDMDAAILDLNKAVTLKPIDKQYLPLWGQVFINRGTVRYYMKDLEGARSDWQRAAELNVPKAAEYLQMYFK